MSITVEFRDFEEMVGFAAQLLGRTDGNPQSGAQPEKPEQPTAAPVASSTQIGQLVAAPAAAPVQAVRPAAAPTSPAVQPAVTPGAGPETPGVPTTTKDYTVDDLARAAIPLMDAGGQQVLVGLLSQFGVATLPQLPKEQYGAFATPLRGLGAKI